MSATPMDLLLLEPQGENWRLKIQNDWSLPAIGGIEHAVQQLHAMPGRLFCDWSGVKTPGIGSVWVLLRRLSDLGIHAEQIEHIDPPAFLTLLLKLLKDRHEAYSAPPVHP